MADQILGGVFQPSDFKILRSREFELAVNGSTAKLLGVEIPSGLKVETVY